MRTRISQGAVTGPKTVPAFAEQNHNPVLERVVDENREELLWIAEVIAGNRPTAEQCVAEAVELAEAARYMAQEWMLSWVKRLLVHVVLKRISGQIRELLPFAPSARVLTLARAGVSASDRERLRTIPPTSIIASLDVLERACLILYLYLDYPVLDCALLLGCPRGWIDSVCERVLSRMIPVDGSFTNHLPGGQFFNSPGVSECAG